MFLKYHQYVVYRCQDSWFWLCCLLLLWGFLFQQQNPNKNWCFWIGVVSFQDSRKYLILIVHFKLFMYVLVYFVLCNFFHFNPNYIQLFLILGFVIFFNKNSEIFQLCYSFSRFFIWYWSLIIWVSTCYSDSKPHL